MAEIIKSESRTVVKSIWAADWEGKNDEVLGVVGGSYLRVVDLLSLEPDEQLNDQIINTYCGILSSKYPNNVFHIDSYILTAIMEGNQDLSFLEREVIESYDLLIGCLHVNGNHWVAIGIDVASKVVWYMDPLYPVYQTVSKRRKCLKNWNKFVRSKGLQQKWKLQVPLDTPRQTDCTSCGVYSLKFLENLVAHEENQNFNTNAVRLHMGMKFLEALSPKKGCHKCCLGDSTAMWCCGICQRKFHRTCQQCYGHVLEMCHLCVFVFITNSDGTSTTPAEVQQQPHNSDVSSDGTSEPELQQPHDDIQEPAAKQPILKRFKNMLKKGKNKGRKWLRKVFGCRSQRL